MFGLSSFIFWNSWQAFKIISVIVINRIEGKKYLDTTTEIVIDWFFLFRKELSIACQCRNIQRVNDKKFFEKVF